MGGRPQLNGAGQSRMEALEDALKALQTMHSIVEQMAIVQKAQQPIAPHIQRLKRAAVPVSDALKGNYTPLADQVTMMLLLATRGGSDRSRVSSLREGVGALRSQIEIAQRKVYENFAVEE